MEPIQSIAKLLLDEEFALKFNNVLKEFNESKDIKEFYHSKNIKPYTQYLDYDYWDDEKSLTAPELLYTFVKKHQISEFIDWSGESYDNQLKTIVSNQLEKRNIVDFNWGFLEIFEENLDWDSLEKGDYILKKLEEVSIELEKINHLLIFLQLTWAGYIPFVVTDKEFEETQLYSSDNRGNHNISMEDINNI